MPNRDNVNLFIGLATLRLLVMQLRLVGQLCLVGQLHLAMHSIGMRFRQLILVGKLRLSEASWALAHTTFAWRTAIQLRLVRQLLLVVATSTSVLSAAVKTLHKAHNQQFRLVKDVHFPQERGIETKEFQRSCTEMIT